MKRLLFILAGLVGAAQAQYVGGAFNPGPTGGGGTWTVVQHVMLNSNSCNNSSFCSMPVSAIGTGHALVLVAAIFNAATNTLTFSTGGGGGTWTNCAACTQNINYTGVNVISGILAYNLSSTSGATTVSMTVAGASPPPPNWALEFVELAWSGSTITLDSSNGGTDATCTSCAGQALTLTGAKDAIVQAISHAIDLPTGISGGAGYTAFADFDPNYAASGVAGALNTTNGAAPTWTVPTTGQAAIAAIAFAGS